MMLRVLWCPTHTHSLSHSPSHSLTHPHALPRYAGPSTIFSANGSQHMLMNFDGGTGLFSATNASFHEWFPSNPRFYPTSSGPAEFFPIPSSTPGVLPSTPGVASPTHMLAGIAGPKPYRSGTAWYTLGTFRENSLDFVNTSEPASLDASNLLIFSQLHQACTDPPGEA